MRYKHFKNADADISALTVGTWGIAGANSAGVTWGDVDTEESIAAIRQMIDNGVNMVDTAPIYGDGHSETVVGQALKMDIVKSVSCNKVWFLHQSLHRKICKR